MVPTSSPAVDRERIAVSRPEPGPLTKTSTFFMPCSIALRAADSAAICAAKGVALRVRDGHDGVVEGGLDVCVTLGHVLLDYAAAAAGARSGALRCSHYFFFPAIVFFGPLRVRALVLVRWPRTGRPRRWRSPW